MEEGNLGGAAAVGYIAIRRLSTTRYLSVSVVAEPFVLLIINIRMLSSPGLYSLVAGINDHHHVQQTGDRTNLSVRKREIICNQPSTEYIVHYIPISTW